MAQKKDWWYTDNEGRRIGWLYPEDFTMILESVYPVRSPMTKFSKEFGIALSTLSRYKNGESPIPRHIAAILIVLNQLYQNGVKPDLKIVCPHPKGCTCLTCMK